MSADTAVIDAEVDALYAYLVWEWAHASELDADDLQSETSPPF